MSNRSLIKFFIVQLLVVLVIILPFLQGPPNRIVIVLSAVVDLIGFLGVAVIPVALIRLWVLRHSNKPGSKMLMMYFIAVPVAAFCARSFLVPPLASSSMEHAIQRTKPIIQAIEKYKIENGVYPSTLAEIAVKTIQLPGKPVMGITGLRYNIVDGHFSLSFSQWLDFASVEKIVLFDEHNIRDKFSDWNLIYDYKLDLCRVHGAFASQKTRHDTWTYFLLD